MTPEQVAAFVNAQAALLNARVAAMTAENMQRAALGHSMAYTEEQFDEVIREYEGTLGHNAALELFRIHQG